MKFTPVPPKQLPQQDPQKVLLLAGRHQRATWAFNKWATPAKKCVDFFRGRQWTAAQIARMKGRAPFKFNIIRPLVMLVLGYHGANKTDIEFSPGDDNLSDEQIADALNAMEKSVAKRNGMEFVDGEVFMDGLITGRGAYDTRLDFEFNNLGEVRTTALDPFSLKIDPDCSTYDLNETASFVHIDRMASLDELESSFGQAAADLVRPYLKGQTPLAPISSTVINDQVTPMRTFGLREDGDGDYWDAFYSMMGDFVDPFRKSIRVIEAQYKVREPRNVFVDLETGEEKVIPDNWDRDHIEKVLLWSETVGNPLRVQRRLVQRYHWTTIVGDLILYDQPSFYDAYTPTLYSPLFLRGDTGGMVEDLIDPQIEKNKRRNARIETDTRTARGGWKYHEKSLNPIQKAQLKKYGPLPGFNLEWTGEHEPQEIVPAQPPVGARQLEADADNDIRRIANINESALGEADHTVRSGRAIEAKQRQSVIGVQLYFSNFKRSKMLVGQRHLSLFQNFYTEQRIFRVTGEDGKVNQLAINQILADPVNGAKRILNDITLGKYTAVIDEAPISATFRQGQYEEMLAVLKEIGPFIGANLPRFADLIIENTSLPRKDEWVARFQQLLGMQQQPGAAPSGGGQPAIPAPNNPNPNASPPGAPNVIPMRR